MELSEVHHVQQDVAHRCSFQYSEESCRRAARRASTPRLQLPAEDVDGVVDGGALCMTCQRDSEEGTLA